MCYWDHHVMGLGGTHPIKISFSHLLGRIKMSSVEKFALSLENVGEYGCSGFGLGSGMGFKVLVQQV